MGKFLDGLEGGERLETSLSEVGVNPAGFRLKKGKSFLINGEQK
jgi:hypothetical protein